jgi:hypothetical protein
MAKITEGVGDIAGVEMPETTEVELTMDVVCQSCSAASQATLNPFTEPVKYTKVGVTEIDGFVESANNLYGTVMVIDKMVGVGEQMAADPNLQVEGFTSRDEVLSLAKTMLGTVQADGPNLVSQSAAAGTAAAGLATDAQKAMIAPTAVEQVKIAGERLNEAMTKVTELAGKFTE